MTTIPLSGAGVSRYLRLYRVLSQALAEGAFGAGLPLPSEPRLMRDYGVSRSTVRRALARLEAEGRIERRRGSGTFARGRGGAAAAVRNLAPALDGTASGPATATRRTIALQRVPTPGFLLERQPEFGGGALLVRQIGYVERQPVVLETAYLPEQIGSGPAGRRLPGEGSILTVLAGSGHRCASLEREFTALGAEPLAADSLRVAVGTPVLNVATLARDDRHRIVAYVSCLYRADRYEAHGTIALSQPKKDRAEMRS